MSLINLPNSKARPVGLKLFLLFFIFCFQLPVVAQKLIFQDDVESSSFPSLTGVPTTGWLKSWQEVNSISISQPFSKMIRSDSFKRAGSYSARFQLDKPYSPYDQYRQHAGAELIWNDACNYQTLDMRWIALSLYIPKWSYQYPEGAPESIGFNIHDKPLPCGTNSKWTNPMRIGIINNRWICVISYDKGDVQANSGSTIKSIEYDLGPVDTDKWTDWAVNRNWTTADNGFVKVYKNGQLVVNYTGPNWYGGNFSKVPYIKVGIYKWPWLASWNTSWGNTIAKRRVVYVDEFKIGNSTATLADVSPAGGSTSTTNTAPVANAGADKIVTLPTTSTTLTGSGTDQNGSIASYAWSKVSGPTGGTIQSPSSASTNITSLAAGTYVYRLTVKDNAGATDTDDVQVIVSSSTTSGNLAPIANAGVNQNLSTGTSWGYLDGRASSDPDGTISSYQWSQVSGPSTASIASPTQVRTTAGGLANGTYSFRLTVMDNDGATSSATTTIVVGTQTVVANNAPTANAGADKAVTLPTSSVSVSGSGTDSDGTIAGYTWTKISGPSGGTIQSPSSSSTTISSLTAGTYVYRLTVKDNDNATSTDDVQINVAQALSSNASPVSVAGPNQTITSPSNWIYLDGRSSYDPDGTVTSYQWSQVSGPNTAQIGDVNASRTTASFLTVGTYIFQLTVRDNDGGTGTSSFTLVVNGTGTANKAPTVSAGNNVSIVQPTSSITLIGSATDSDGSISKYAWSFVSGPGGSSIQSPSNSATNVTGLTTVGTYTYRLTVTDNSGATASAEVSVSVLAAPSNIVSGQAPVANAGSDVSITLPTNWAYLDGRSSFDSDGTIVSYNWAQISGPSTASITDDHQARTAAGALGTAGTYTFRLTVTDDKGMSSSDTKSIIVRSSTTSSNSSVSSGMEQTSTTTTSTTTTSTTTTGTTVTSPVNTTTQFKTYPNPFNNNLTLLLNTPSLGKTTIQVYNMVGLLVHQEVFNKDQISITKKINLVKLIPGMYVLKATTERDAPMTTKIEKL